MSSIMCVDNSGEPLEGRALEISFSQESLIKNIGAPYQALNRINSAYGGLCEIICNYVLINDLLNREEGCFSAITLDALNNKKIISSHLLEVYSLHEKIKAYFFRIYPDNLFFKDEQNKLIINIPGGEDYFDTVEIDHELLQNKLKEINIGETIKFETFSQNIFSTKGHSLLIKKNESNVYTFFDPNKGEFRFLSLENLINKINNALCGYDNALFIKGSDYLKRLNIKDQSNGETSISKLKPLRALVDFVYLISR